MINVFNFEVYYLSFILKVLHKYTMFKVLLLFRKKKKIENFIGFWEIPVEIVLWILEKNEKCVSRFLALEFA